MSNFTDASLATLSDLLGDPTLKVQVSLDGPAFWPDDLNAAYPEVRVGVEVLQTAGTAHLPIENQLANKSFASVFQRALNSHLGTELSKYKPWELESKSVVRKGGLCPTHRKKLESYLISQAPEVARSMMLVEKSEKEHESDIHPPDWVTFVGGDRLRHDHAAQNGYETSLPLYREPAYAFFCQNTLPNALLEDNCLCRTVTSVRDSRIPLASEISNRSLGLTIELKANPLKVWPRVKSKWTVHRGSLDLGSPEVQKQLSIFEPLLTAFTRQFKKEYNDIVAKPGSERRSIEDMGLSALVRTSDHSFLQSGESGSYPFSGQCYPFSGLRTNLNYIEPGWRDWMTPSKLKKKHDG